MVDKLLENQKTNLEAEYLANRQQYYRDELIDRFLKEDEANFGEKYKEEAKPEATVGRVAEGAWQEFKHTPANWLAAVRSSFENVAANMPDEYANETYTDVWGNEVTYGQKKQRILGTAEKIKGWEESDTFKMSPEFEGQSSGFAEDVARGVGGSFADMAFMLLSPVLGPSAMMPMYAHIKGASYTNLVERAKNKFPDLSDDEITKVANLASSINAGMQLPLEAIGNIFKVRGLLGNKSFSRLIGGIGESMLGEGATEFIQQFPEEFALTMVLNPDLSIGDQWEIFKASIDKDMLRRAGYAGAVGAAAGGVTTGAISIPQSATGVGTDLIEQYGEFISPKQKKINEEKRAKLERLNADYTELKLEEDHRNKIGGIDNKIKNLEAYEHGTAQNRIAKLRQEKINLMNEKPVVSKAYSLAMETDRQRQSNEITLSKTVREISGLEGGNLVNKSNKLEYVDPTGDDAVRKRVKAGTELFTPETIEVEEGNVNKFDVNFNKIKSAEDVDTIINKMSNTYSKLVEEDTREAQTEAQTVLLARDLGLTEEGYREIKAGEALTAEQAIASRQLINKSTNRIIKLANKVAADDIPIHKFEFQRAVKQHGAIKQQILGYKVKANNTLQSFNLKSGTETYMVRQMHDILGDTLFSNKNDTLAKTIIKRKGSVDARYLNREITDIVDGYNNTKTQGLFITFIKNNLLASPYTHERNFIVNFGTNVMLPMEKATAAMIGRFSKWQDLRDYNRLENSGELNSKKLELKLVTENKNRTITSYNQTREEEINKFTNEFDKQNPDVDEHIRRKEIDRFKKNYDLEDNNKSTLKYIKQLEKQENNLMRKTRKPQDYDYTRFTESAKMAQGWLFGIKNSFKVLKDVMPDVALLRGIPSEYRKFNSKVELSGEISSPISALINAPGTLMEVGDLLFSKGVTENMMLYGAAYDMAVKIGIENNMNDEGIAQTFASLIDEYKLAQMDPENHQSVLDNEIEKQTEYALFRQPLEGTGKNIHDLIRQNKVGEYIIPFFRTPWNIMNFAMERTPGLQFLNKKFKSEWNSSNPAMRDLAKAKLLMSSVTAAAVTSMFFSGLITGRGPTDKKERANLFNQGWQPYSFKMGDKYYSYQNFEPAGFTVGLIADTCQILGDIDESDSKQLFGSIMFSLANNLTDKTFMSNIADVVTALDEPERYGDTFLANKLTMVIPYKAGFKFVKDVVDPMYRRTEVMGGERNEQYFPGSNVVELEIANMLNEIYNTIPGLSTLKDENNQDILPPVLNAWGETRQREYLFLTPIKTSEEKYSPVDYELQRLGIGIDMPGKVPIIKGVKTPLRSDEYNMYIYLTNNKDMNGKPIGRGKTLKGELSELIDKKYYIELNTEDKIQEIRSKIETSREDARNALYELSPTVRGYVDANRR